MKWYNTWWKWPAEIIDDYRQWSVVRDALKEEETLSVLKTFKYELRQDRIGRLYTVINIPEELWPYEKQDQVWPWMVEQLRDLDYILMQRQLSDLLYPVVERIPDAPAYLVVLTPSTESLKWSKLFSWIFSTGLLTFSIFLANRITFRMSGHTILEHFISLF